MISSNKDMPPPRQLWVVGPVDAYALYDTDYDGRQTNLLGVFKTRERAQQSSYNFTQISTIKVIHVDDVTYILGSPTSVPFDVLIRDLKARLIESALAKLTPEEIAALTCDRQK
jgi:hypothetical protein